MKVLWIVNTIFPYPAQKLGIEESVFGGWLNGLAENLKNEEKIELAIATTYNGSNIKKFYDGKIVYYLIPSKNNLRDNKKVLEEFNPDILHIHGTEFNHGMSFFDNCSENTKKIISIQGLTSCISKVYLSGISYKDIIKNITIRDILKRDNIFQQRRKFINSGKHEIELIKKADNIIGRTIWDQANTKAINSNIKYYIGNETLRSNFYNQEWKIENIEKNTIFCSQASYPIKGLHYLLEAISILKKKYKDIKLYVAGYNIIENNTLKKKIKLSGYAKFLKKLIKKYNLEDNVIFTGILNEEKMIEKLLKTHVFVLPSVIENSSNSLGEAMLIRNALCSFKYRRNDGYTGT